MRPFPVALREKFALFKTLTTPRKIQDFIDKDLRMNFEVHRETYRSPLMTLRYGEAHCAEGAMLAAACFWYHGEPPLLLDLKVVENKGDVDHVVTLFKEGGYWGAISKTNHAVLRYRDPIYKTIRELALSYFNEYFLDSGEKTLRSYSMPFDMSRQDDAWLISQKNLWYIINTLDESRHCAIVSGVMVRRLRPADSVEIEAGRITQWSKEK